MRVIRVAEGERVLGGEPLTEEDEGEDDALPMGSELPDPVTQAAIEAAERAEAEAEAEAEARDGGEDE